MPNDQIVKLIMEMFKARESPGGQRRTSARC